MSMLFVSQYMAILLSALLNAAHMQSAAQIIWAGVGAGYLFSVAICFNEGNKDWHAARKRIKKYKDPKKFGRAMLKYGSAYGLLIFFSVAASFFVCLLMKDPAAGFGIFEKYINADAANAMDIRAAQTAAFVSCLAARASMALRYAKGRSKFYIFVLMANIVGVLCAVLISPLRDFLGFGEIGAMGFFVSAALGLLPSAVAAFIGKNLFF
jgi:hypothetical protein